LDVGAEFCSKHGEESLEGFDGSLLPGPEQARAARVDLVDQGEVHVVFGILNLVHADGRNQTQSAMCQALVHYCTAWQTLSQEVRNDTGVFFPGQFAHPACQKEHVSFAEWVLAIGPGTSSTTRRRFCSGPGACGRGEKPRSPNGDELERTLSELIVAGRWSATTGGDGFGTYTWPYPDLEAACHLR